MATPKPAKPWKAEYAKSGRSSCKTCKSPIDKDALRLGKMVTATNFDGFMPMWNHASCIFKKANQIKSLDDVEGIDSLRWDDQQNIKKYLEAISLNKAATINNEHAVEVSQTSRAACKRCNGKIMKGSVRVSTKPEGQSAKGVQWHHANCFIEMLPSTNLEKLSGWESLSPQDKETLSSLVKTDISSTKGGTKRKKDGNEDRNSKAPKPDGNITADGLQKGKKIECGNLNIDHELENELERQTKALWAIKDELKKHVTIGELREMLEANDQDSSGSEHDLRDRCADGMLFGALARCPLCSGQLHYSGGVYRCHGYLSAWSKCSFSTSNPPRLKGKWKIPDGTTNDYLLKWFKSQKAKKPQRILKPSTGHFGAPKQSQPSASERLEDLTIALSGKLMRSKEEWKRKLEEAGVKIHANIKKDTSCFVVGEDIDELEIKKARRMKIPIVRENYLDECIGCQKKLPFDLYKVETSGETSRSGMVTVKVKGQSAVHESSGLQDTGHILEDGKIIYNTTLSMSDLSTGINSYYILQIIQEDKGSDCYVFRKWGRVGSDRIGGQKLEQMSKSDAISEFKRLFLEKTGNPWEAWEQKQNFEKKPGRFFPLDIDYGVKQAVSRGKDLIHKDSQLPPQVAQLMKMLFNVETYRAAMLEFEINMSEMPLGKLSKENIQKGYEALTEIQNLLNDNHKYDTTMKESLIIDASNRFFTLIPSIHPHVIRDDVDFKAKVKMLEALQDIEIASRLVGFNSDETVDEKYKKLKCDIVPIPHDSQDYKLVKHYLLNTHAPTHTDWSLELEDVFILEREGESSKYAKYKNRLHTKMLLWHGSRLTNFVGILSQGLRIAPPEAPTTGYMFGKGVYFADLVSKSAQYCFVDKKDPVGLMLLSEVALGEMYELKSATYMEKPPKGKHSIKGLGKTVPLESEFVKWRNDVVVPCGRPVPSGICKSELMYNEYIVYDTAQVKLQFLLKVRFRHKR